MDSGYAVFCGTGSPGMYYFLILSKRIPVFSGRRTSGGNRVGRGEDCLGREAITRIEEMVKRREEQRDGREGSCQFGRRLCEAR